MRPVFRARNVLWCVSRERVENNSGRRVRGFSPIRGTYANTSGVARVRLRFPNSGYADILFNSRQSQ